MLAAIDPVLGVMKFETEPLSFEDWRRLAWLGLDWLQDAGGFAMVGLVIWVVNGLLNPVYDILPDGKKRNRWSATGMLPCRCRSALTALSDRRSALAVFRQRTSTRPRRDDLLPRPIVTEKVSRPSSKLRPARSAGCSHCSGSAGRSSRTVSACAGGRIYAIAKLSFKEAVRRRVVWVFLGILVMYLFPARWFFQEKPEDELKSIVGVTTRGMNVLLIFVGLLLAAFSIPTDIKNLTIHTIVTKPVERFEIVLGRFLGYLGLMTAGIADHDRVRSDPDQRRERVRGSEGRKYESTGRPVWRT